MFIKTFGITSSSKQSHHEKVTIIMMLFYAMLTISNICTRLLPVSVSVRVSLFSCVVMLTPVDSTKLPLKVNKSCSPSSNPDNTITACVMLLSTSARERLENICSGGSSSVYWPVVELLAVTLGEANERTGGSLMGWTVN